jgi:hypothetical protein
MVEGIFEKSQVSEEKEIIIEEGIGVKLVFGMEKFLEP